MNAGAPEICSLPSALALFVTYCWRHTYTLIAKIFAATQMNIVRYKNMKCCVKMDNTELDINLPSTVKRIKITKNFLRRQNYVRYGKYSAIFISYCMITVLFFGLPVLLHLQTYYSGVGQDPTLYIWSFQWLHVAIKQQLNIFYTQFLWAPAGYNLAWATFIPGLALLGLPITMAAGPIAAYNIIAVMQPALAAFTAFLLCYYLTKRFPAAWFGGYIFGFSSYELAQMRGHLDIAAIFLLPLSILLFLLRRDNKINAPVFIISEGVIIAWQLYISIEIAAIFCVFSVIALLIYFALQLIARKHEYVLDAKIILELFLSGIAGLVFAAPLIIYLFMGIGGSLQVTNDTSYYSIDLLNFLAPTELTRFGEIAYGISHNFTGNLSENGGYIGLPLLLLLGLFLRNFWKYTYGKLLGILLLIIAISSLGPILHINGRYYVAMPWAVMAHAPLLAQALPSRFTLYMFLLLGIAAALWLAQPRTKYRNFAAYGLAVLAIVAISPNFTKMAWATRYSTPAFFSNKSIYSKYLTARDVVLTIPFGYKGVSMFWQTQADFQFQLMGGYFGSTPPAFQTATIDSFLQNKPISPQALKAFVAQYHVNDIIVSDALEPVFADSLSGLKIAPAHVGGVWLYQISNP